MRFLLATSVLALSASIVLTAAGKTGDSPRSRPGIVSVQGTGRISTAPDEAYVRFAVAVTRKTTIEATNDAAEAMTRLRTAILALDGVRETDLATSGLSLYPEHRGRNKPDGTYEQVSCPFSVHLSLFAPL